MYFAHRKHSGSTWLVNMDSGLCVHGYGLACGAAFREMGKSSRKDTLQSRSIHRSSSGDNTALENLCNALREQVPDLDIHQQRIPVLAGRSESSLDEHTNRAGSSVIHAVFPV